MQIQVNDILDFLQIVNNKFVRKDRFIDLKSSIRNFIKMFKIGAEEKGIELRFECDTEFPSRLLVDE